MTSLLLVGHGKMGSALLARWREKFLGFRFEVVEPSLNKTLAALPANYHPDIIVFAVKPQQLAEVLPDYKKRFGAKPLYISIAAGKTLAFFAKYLGADTRIVRAMPNAPALIGYGMTVLSAVPALSQADNAIATQLMEATGDVVWADESHMDAVTALSGSGPAYVFLFLDALTKAGIAAGLPKDAAETLAIETVAGSCALADQSEENFDQLRINVTSSGGTTEAALKVLMKDNALEKLVKEAVLAAAKKSKELAEK